MRHEGKKDDVLVSTDRACFVRIMLGGQRTRLDQSERCTSAEKPKDLCLISDAFAGRQPDRDEATSGILTRGLHFTKRTLFLRMNDLL